MHEFLKSRIINQQRQEAETALNSSVNQSWEEISLQIEKHILFGKHKKKSSSCCGHQSWPTLGKWITNLSKGKNYQVCDWSF